MVVLTTTNFTDSIFFPRWFVIIQKTRPLIGLPNPEEELRLLEEKANATYGVYKEKLDTKEKLLEENKIIDEEKKALIKQIESEQGNVSQYHERQAKISAQRSELELDLASAQDTLVRTEQARVQATQDKKELEQESMAIKKDIGDIEMVIQKLEQEKTNKDHTIKTLNDEIANQDEIINKLNKVKKYFYYYHTVPGRARLLNIIRKVLIFNGSELNN